MDTKPTGLATTTTGRVDVTDRDEYGLIPAGLRAGRLLDPQTVEQIIDRGDALLGAHRLA